MAIENLGRVAYVDRGAFSENVAYVKKDVVQYQNGSYVLTAESAQGILPTDISAWQAMLDPTAMNEATQAARQAAADAFKINQGTEYADRLLYIAKDGRVSSLKIGDGLALEALIGKNIVHGTWENGLFNISTGYAWYRLSSGFNHVGINTLFPVQPGGTYTASWQAPASYSTYFYLTEFDASGAFVAQNRLAVDLMWRTQVTFTLAENTAFIGIYLYEPSGQCPYLDIVPEGFMIEKGEAATGYEPYWEEGAEIHVPAFASLMEENAYTKLNPSVLLPEMFENAAIGGTGKYTALTTKANHAACAAFLPVLSGCSYQVTYETGVNASIYAHFYAAADETTWHSVQLKYNAGGDFSFTVPDGTHFVRFQLYFDGAAIQDLIPANMHIMKQGMQSQPMQQRIIRTDRLDAAEIFEAMRQLGLAKGGKPLPEYYFANDYLQQKCSRIRTLYDACAGKGEAFFFVTDQHWPLNAGYSPALMRYIGQKTHISRVFSGGDTADAASEEYADCLQDEMGDAIHHAMGNHDYFAGVDGHQLARMFDAGKAMQQGNAYRHYYYVDQPQQKIRFIVLNPFDTNAVQNAQDMSVSSLYDAAQIAWLSGEALNVPNHWTVFVFTHCLYYGDQQSQTLAPWPEGAGNVIAALDNAACTVACIFQGHLHLDRICHTPGGIPVVTTTCDKYQPWIDDSTDREPWITAARTAGTITEQAFDVAVWDQDERKITLVRIGAPADNWQDGVSSGTVEERIVAY